MSGIRESFRLVHQRPQLAALEIAWRWTFGLVATVLLLLGTRAFVAGLNVTPPDAVALRGTDPTMFAAALVHIFQQEGVWQRFLEIAVVIVIPTVLVWIAAATFGRIAVLKRLLARPHVEVAAVLYLTIARVALLFACIALWYLWMVICAFVAMNGETMNYPLYLLLSFITLPIIAIGWGILNWILSFAPLLVVRDGCGAMQAYSGALQLARQERPQFIAVTSWLVFPRLMAIMPLLLFALVALFAIRSALTATLLLALVTLVYCAFADYLYVVRLAAYAAIAETSIAAAGN